MSGAAVNGSGSPMTMEPDAELAPVEEVSEIMDSASDDGPDLAGDEDPQTFSATDLTEEQIAAGLQRMSGGIATAQDVENAARAEEGLPPLEGAGLLDFGPFNSDAALKAIFEKSAEVRTLQADYDRKKEAASDAKRELDLAAKALVAIIESLKNRRSQALHPSQPYLKDVSGDAPASSACPWELAHPGQECPVCSQAKKQLTNVDVNSEVHPEHERHAAIAEAARVKNVLIPLSEKLVAVNVYADPLELAGLSTDELNGLIAYADEPTPMPPHILVKTCVALAPGEMAQCCGTCGLVLATITTERGWYPEGARVGFGCKGAIDNGVAEAPHKPRSHAKKNRARKTAPEAERTAQAAEGKKRAAPAKKAKAAKRGRR